MPVEKKHRNYCGVYVVTDGTACKVGITDNFATRLVALQNGNPRRIVLYEFVRATSMAAAQRAEQATHRTLAAVRLHGEWFSASPETAAAVVRAALDGKPESYNSFEAMSERALKLLKKVKKTR